MENLTNEQIIDIIEFYKLCGIADETYLSKDGALDLFTLLKFKPEFDDDGNRVLTPYELLEIIPKVENGEEVPIVFAIKNRVKKVSHNPERAGTFTYVGGREIDSLEVLNKFKHDYYNAVAEGNVSEASRIFDLIDNLTSGHGEEFIGINYNAEMFYIKMKRQLLIDLFANFLILRIMNRKSQVKEGLLKADKLYKEFVEQQKKNGDEMQDMLASAAPIIENFDIVIPDELEEDEPAQENVNAKLNVNVSKQTQETIINNSIAEHIESFIKSKIEKKIKNLKKPYADEFETAEKQEEKPEKNTEKNVAEKTAAVLESN
jgi:hypothetical protein